MAVNPRLNGLFGKMVFLAAQGSLFVAGVAEKLREKGQTEICIFVMYLSRLCM
jgi:hypothetical protein